MIEVFFIKSLEKSYFEKTYQSFQETVLKDVKSDFVIQTIEELETREDTLNKILEVRHPKHNLLIVADDIVFTKGWLKNLKQNMDNGEVIGFSMAKLKRDKLSNRGFEFVKIGNKLTYSPLNKGEKFQVDEKGFVECDFVTGCLMFVKKSVLQHDFTFPEEGFNRWGEILFVTFVKQKGFKVICLNHTVYHEGIATKNKAEKYSSTSYLIEQNLWNIACSTHLKNLNIKKNIKVEIDESLKKLIENKEKKLIYGCGTVCDYILTTCSINNVTLVSGLKEEHGLKFHNLNVKKVKEVNLKTYKYIINTAIGYEKEVKEQYFKSFKVITLNKHQSQAILTIKINTQ